MILGILRVIRLFALAVRLDYLPQNANYRIAKNLAWSRNAITQPIFSIPPHGQPRIYSSHCTQLEIQRKPHRPRGESRATSEARYQSHPKGFMTNIIRTLKGFMVYLFLDGWKGQHTTLVLLIAMQRQIGSVSLTRCWPHSKLSS